MTRKRRHVKSLPSVFVQAPSDRVSLHRIRTTSRPRRRTGRTGLESVRERKRVIVLLAGGNWRNERFGRQGWQRRRCLYEVSFERVEALSALVVVVSLDLRLVWVRSPWHWRRRRCRLYLLNFFSDLSYFSSAFTSTGWGGRGTSKSNDLIFRSIKFYRSRPDHICLTNIHSTAPRSPSSVTPCS